MVVEDGITSVVTLSKGTKRSPASGYPLVNRASAEVGTGARIGPRAATRLSSRSDTGVLTASLMRCDRAEDGVELAPYLGFGGTRPPACDVIRHG